MIIWLWWLWLWWWLWWWWWWWWWWWIRIASSLSVYLLLWSALVSRSQVSLINFVASLCGAGGIQAFKTMRTLRALRPLRAMSRMQGMRVCSPQSQQTLPITFLLCSQKNRSLFFILGESRHWVGHMFLEKFSSHENF